MYQNRFEGNFDDFMAFGPGQLRRAMKEMGGFRAGRGMVEPAILHVLQGKPMHGYEIISTLEEKSHGMWRPSAGSIYPTLQLLEEKGLIQSSEQDGKKVYELTEEGQREAGDRADFRHPGWHDKGARIHQFHREMGKIMMLIHTIARRDDDEEHQALADAIRAFRESLEDITKGKS